MTTHSAVRVKVDARTWTHGNVVPPRACVHGLRPTSRRTDGADAAVCRRGTLHMLNYMLLTVVTNGHNCVATATAGYAQGHCQDFTLVAT